MNAPTGLVVPPSECDRDVVTTETGTVRYRDIHGPRSRGVGRIVEHALRIRRGVVDRGRHDIVTHGQGAGNKLHRSCRPQHMSGRRLGRADGQRSRVIAKHGLNAFGLVGIVQRR